MKFYSELEMRTRKDILTIIVLACLSLTAFARDLSAERLNFRSALNGYWNLYAVSHSGERTYTQESFSSSYMQIFSDDVVEYSGACTSYNGSLQFDDSGSSSSSTSRARSRRLRSKKFLYFKLNEIDSKLIHCLALDDFEAYKDRLFQARILRRNRGLTYYLKLKAVGDAENSMVLTFKQELLSIYK